MAIDVNSRGGKNAARGIGAVDYCAIQESLREHLHLLITCGLGCFPVDIFYLQKYIYCHIYKGGFI
jgi:hypothetical protein